MATPTFQTTMLSAKLIDASSKTEAWTLDAGSNRKVFVVLDFKDSTNLPTSMTYAGFSLSKIGSEISTSCDLEIWAGNIPNGVSGSQNLIITCPGTPSPSIKYYAFSVNDAGSLSTPTFQTGTGGSGATRSQSLMAPVNSLILGFYFWILTFGYDSKSGNQTQRYLNPASGASDYEMLTTGDGSAGGLITFTIVYDPGYDRAYNMTMISVSLAIAESGNSISVNNENGVSV
jgi:hypothetical protein